LDNATLERLADPDDALIRIAQVPGPVALVPGGGDEPARLLAAALCGRYCDASREPELVARCLLREQPSSFPIRPATPEEAARLIL
jgi:hypothetical protein